MTRDQIKFQKNCGNLEKQTHRQHSTSAKIFSPEDYAILLKNCACLVGNSSSGIREGAYLGVPAVNIGTRQRGRETGQNVQHVVPDRFEIEKAIRTQLKRGHYEHSPIFGHGNAGEIIAETLADIDLSIDKILMY